MTLEHLRKFRWVIYPTVFIALFVVSLVVFFPNDTVRHLAKNGILRAAVALGPSDRGMPEVTMENASLWRFSGVEVDKLRINWAGSMEKAPIDFAVDAVKGRVGFWSALVGKKHVVAQVKSFGGKVDTEINLKKDNQLAYLFLEIAQLDLGKISVLSDVIGAKLAGIIDAYIEIDAKNGVETDGQGEGSLAINNASFGPGNVNLPVGGFVSTMPIPKLSLGQLHLEYELVDKKITTKSFTLKDGDLKADVSLTITLNKNFKNSTISGGGWFSLDKKFIATNETIKTLYDIIPELRMANEGDGKVSFSLDGTIGRPRPSFQTAVLSRK